MEGDAICCKNSLCDFTAGEFCVCRKSKMKHEKLTTENIPEDTKPQLNSMQTGSIKTNLIQKIQIIDSCSRAILDKTQIFIAKLQDMCMHSIKTLNIKKQYYIRLLNSCDKSCIPEERKNIQRELKTFLVGRIPTYNIKELNGFYSFNFITEISKIRKFSSLRINDFTNILEEEYKLPMAPKFNSGRCLQGHSKSITALSITSDNKYIISGGKDTTVRI